MDFIRQEKHLFVFLCETISKEEKLEWLRRTINLDGLFVVDPGGRSGGLALLWKEKDQIEGKSYSKNHIDMIAKVEGSISWRLTGFYGEPDRALRRNTWDFLRFLARDSNLLFCVIGDPNNIVFQEDKKGGPQYPNWLIEGFDECLGETGLTDLELVGNQYTLERGRDSDDWVELRLDRALVSCS